MSVTGKGLFGAVLQLKTELLTHVRRAVGWFESTAALGGRANLMMRGRVTTVHSTCRNYLQNKCVKILCDLSG